MSAKLLIAFKPAVKNFCRPLQPVRVITQTLLNTEKHPEFKATIKTPQQSRPRNNQDLPLAPVWSPPRLGRVGLTRNRPEGHAPKNHNNCVVRNFHTTLSVRGRYLKDQQPTGLTAVGTVTTASHPPSTTVRTESGTG